MRRTRLLLAALPRMLSEILRDTIGPQPDMEIAGELDSLEGLDTAAEDVRPDLLIVAAPRGALPRECERLMYRFPRIHTMSVSPDGATASAYRLLPRGVVIEDLSPGGIVGSIRALERARADLGG